MTLIIDFIAIFLWLNYLFYEESFDEYMGRAKRSGDHDPGINDRGYNKFMKRLYPYLKIKRYAKYFSIIGSIFTLFLILLKI